MINTPSETLHILLRALSICATKWTNKGYKIRQEDGTFKVCVRGAVDAACLELTGRNIIDSDPPMILLNEMSHELYSRSCVSANDELGYGAVIRLFAITIERLFYAIKPSPDTRRLGHTSPRIAP